MKKIKIVIYVIFIISIIIFIPPKYDYAATTIMKGDVTQDKKIDVEDILQILRHISATNTNSNSEWILKDEKFQAANVVEETDKTKPEKLDVLDMLRLLRYIAAKGNKEIEEKHPKWVELGETTSTTSISSNTLVENNQQTAKTEPTTIQTQNKVPTTTQTQSKVPTTTTQTQSKVQTTTQTQNKTQTTITEIKTKNLKLSKKSLQLQKGKTATLKVTINPSNVTNKKITWKSSNTTVATVKNGIVIAKRIGQAKITATNGEKTSTCTVTVIDPVKVITIKANNKKVTANSTVNINKKQTIQLSTTVKPKDAAITYKSSNEKIVKVDKKGKITGISKGVAKITVIAKTNNTMKFTFKVNVNVPVDSLKIKYNNKAITKLTIERNKTVKLKYEIHPSDVTDKKIVWKSSNEKIIEIKDGTITAKKIGTATITATASNNVKAKCKITVKEKDLNILCIGNSKIVANCSFIDTFKALATATSKKISIQEYAVAGQTIEGHSTSGGLMNVIASKKWDYIVLQEQTDAAYSNPNSIKQGGKAIYDYAKTHGSKDVIMVYNVMAISRDFNNNEYTLANKYHEEASKLTGGIVAYTTDAFLKCHYNSSSIDLFTDYVHPNSEGTYLSACCVYATIYNTTPVGINDNFDRVSQSTKSILQKYAAETMKKTK